jgi:class 3 adenylate cyclase/tetratricopeptide (TPR) repeat protein
LDFQGSRQETERVSSFAPYLPRLVVDWSREGLPPAHTVDGTLVSLDLSGFTRLSERLQAKGRAGAEELVLAVSGVFQGLIGIAERHAGDVLKFRGDALLLFFSGNGHERRACLASSHMQWLIGQTGKTMSSVGSVTLRMSTGIYSGSCNFFLVEGTHRELVVAGPAATATIELEGAASAGQILVSERTAEALEPAWLGTAKGGGRLLRKFDQDDVEAHFASAVKESRDDLAHYIPEPLRAQLVLEAGEAEHRQITAAFLKFGGVDDLLESEGADAVHARLDELARLVGETTSELGVTWLESDIDVGGGKLYLVAGAPSSTGADEERMLRALRQIIDNYDALPVRAGVNRGPAFCGDVGAETRRTYAVMGDTVNLAARLTGRASVGGILATADVLDRSRTRFATESEPFLMKGKERPVTAYHVGAATGIQEEEAVAEVPFVGRESELETFTEAVNTARMREQRLVELVGEPGIGKSRLVEELKRSALGFTQLVAVSDQYASSTPYHVFRSLLRPLAGITLDLSPEEAGAHLTPWVKAVMPDLAPWLPLLAIPFGAEVESTPETDEIDPNFRRQRLNVVVDDFLSRVLMMPTLLVIEDVHWMDDASRELLVHVTGSTTPRPWLICVTRRPHGTQIARDTPAHVLLELAPLEPEATHAFVLAAAGDVALSQDALGVLQERSGGNPLFLRELVAAARAGVGPDELPETVETLIVARIDTLKPEDRFVMRNASVAGARFTVGLLSEVLAQELQDLDELERWERLSEFIAWLDEGWLQFLHDLFRAAAYEGLSFKRRREVHARVGRALEARGAQPSLLAVHFLRAEEYDKAWQCASEAGDAARGRYANVEAAELYGQALESAEHLELPAADVARVAEALGDVAELAARYDEATERYAQARKLLPDDPRAQARLMHKEGVVRERLGRYTEALRWYGRALKLLDASESPETRLEVELAYSGVKYRQGHFAEGIEWAQRAAAGAEAQGDRTRLAHAYYLEHIAGVELGRRTAEHRDLALSILEEVGDLVRLSSLQNNIGVEAYFDGRWEESADWYKRSAETSARAGDVVNVARAQNNEGEILSDQGRLEEAQALFEEALRVWRAAGYRIGMALATSNLGRLAARAGRFDEARGLLEEALAAFGDIGADAYVADTQGRLAECLVLEGRHKEALTVLKPLLAVDGTPGQRVALERLAGYAVVQGRNALAKAKPHFDRSLEAARAVDAQYELALTLNAVAQTSGSDGAEAREIFERLGVVTTPVPPLP